MQCRDPINTVPYQVNVIPTKTRYSMTIDAERQFSQNALVWSSFVYKKGTYAKEKILIVHETPNNNSIKD